MEPQSIHVHHKSISSRPGWLQVLDPLQWFQLFRRLSLWINARVEALTWTNAHTLVGAAWGTGCWQDDEWRMPLLCFRADSYNLLLELLQGGWFPQQLCTIYIYGMGCNQLTPLKDILRTSRPGSGYRLTQVTHRVPEDCLSQAWCV